MKNIWQDLPRPFFVLAPMQGVTHSVFRRYIKELGAPDLMYTEFVSVEGICNKGIEKTAQSLKYSPEEKPLIAQIWGLNPEYYYQTTKKLIELGFDGVDINFGCPVRDVIKKGACSAMVKTPDKAVELIKATQAAAKGKIPVSVKIRIGFDEIVTIPWCTTLLKTEIDALIIHGRTTKEMSKVPTHWDEIGKAVKLRDELGLKTPIVGNGDVVSLEQGHELVKKHGVDGVMIARGIFQDPWLFSKTERFEGKTKLEKMQAFKAHNDLFTEFYGEGRGYERMKRFVKVYVRGFRGARKLTDQFMQTNSYEDFVNILDSSL